VCGGAPLGAAGQDRRDRCLPIEALFDGGANHLLARLLLDPHLDGAVTHHLVGLAQIALARLAEDGGVSGRRRRLLGRLAVDHRGVGLVLRELDHDGVLLHDRQVARRHKVGLARLDGLGRAILHADAHLAALEVAKVCGGAPLGAAGQHRRDRLLPVKALLDRDPRHLLALRREEPHLGRARVAAAHDLVWLAELGGGWRGEDRRCGRAWQLAADLSVEAGRASGRASVQRLDRRLDHLAGLVHVQRERLGADLDALARLVNGRQLVRHRREGGASVRAHHDDVGGPATVLGPFHGHLGEVERQVGEAAHQVAYRALEVLLVKRRDRRRVRANEGEHVAIRVILAHHLLGLTRHLLSVEEECDAFRDDLVVLDLGGVGAAHLSRVERV